jgi:hypothetical protein
MKKINCYKCRHYYVTWERRLPHGCRAMSFKSSIFPALTVRRNSGMNCLFFEAKNKEIHPLKKNNLFSTKA